jgi:hypothetical protein
LEVSGQRLADPAWLCFQLQIFVQPILQVTDIPMIYVVFDERPYATRDDF